MCPKKLAPFLDSLDLAGHFSRGLADDRAADAVDDEEDDVFAVQGVANSVAGAHEIFSLRWLFTVGATSYVMLFYIWLAAVLQRMWWC